MKNIIAIIAYDGSKFLGFANSPKSVEISLKKAFLGLGLEVKIIGSGRTDKGVHALNQVVSFELEKMNYFKNLEYLKNILNQRLMPNILIKKMFLSSLHPRFDAKFRIYRYIFSNELFLPFFRSYISQFNFGDLSLAQKAIQLFIGKYDFSSFKKNGSNNKNNIRIIYNAKIYKIKICNINCFIISICGNAFLRSQIRLIVSAIIKASFGYNLEKIKMQIENKLDLNSCIRDCVEPNGLYLAKVIY